MAKWLSLNCFVVRLCSRMKSGPLKILFFPHNVRRLGGGKKRKKQMTTLLQRQSVSRHCRNKRRMTLKGDQRDVLMGSSLRRGLPEGRALLEGAAWGLSAAKGRSDVCVGDARVF